MVAPNELTLEEISGRQIGMKKVKSSPPTVTQYGSCPRSYLQRAVYVVGEIPQKTFEGFLIRTQVDRQYQETARRKRGSADNNY